MILKTVFANSELPPLTEHIVVFTLAKQSSCCLFVNYKHNCKQIKYTVIMVTFKGLSQNKLHNIMSILWDGDINSKRPSVTKLSLYLFPKTSIGNF